MLCCVCVCVCVCVLTDGQGGCFLAQVCGVFTFGYTMGTLSGYIIDGKLDPKTQKYNEMMPKIESCLLLRITYIHAAFVCKYPCVRIACRLYGAGT